MFRRWMLKFLAQYLRCCIFRVFPVTISSTTIFNMGPVVGPLTSLLQQETLPEDGVAECQKVIMT